MLSIRQLEIEKKAILSKIAMYLNKCFCFSDMELSEVKVSVDEVRDHLKSLDTVARLDGIALMHACLRQTSTTKSLFQNILKVAKFYVNEFASSTVEKNTRAHKVVGDKIC